jgi:hypothetical protein
MAKEIVKEEKPIHKKAFEVYYQLGEERSIRKVAAKMNKSPATIQNWSGSFNWKERVEIRDATVQETLEKKVIDTVVSLKADYHKILKATILGAVQDIKDGKLKVESISDLRTVMEMDLKLMGEEDRRNKGQMDALNDAIAASMQMFGGMVYDGKARMDDPMEPTKPNDEQ